VPPENAKSTGLDTGSANRIVLCDVGISYVRVREAAKEINALANGGEKLICCWVLGAARTPRALVSGEG
jgi:hypothetical protein